MSLRGKYGKPSRFQQAAFVANSLLSGRVSINMPGVRGGGSAKSARNARRRANKRNRNNISNISYSTGSMLTGGTSFTGPRPPMARRSPNINADWKINGGLVKMSLASRLSNNVRIGRLQHAVHTDKYEFAGTVDFDSPNQSINGAVFFTKQQILDALAGAAGTMTSPSFTANTTNQTNGAFVGQQGAAGDTNFNWNPNLSGLGNIRQGEINFTLEGMYVKRSYQNSCTNNLEFEVECWKPKYPMFNGPNANVYSQANFQIATMTDVVSTLVAGVGNNAMNDTVFVSANATANENVSPIRYGSKLGQFSLVRQYWVRKGSIKFVLKPGEQRDIVFSVRGPHRIDQAKLRMFMNYSTTLDVTTTCRAQLVGSNVSAVVSHGAGQYYVADQMSVRMRFCGPSIAPTRRFKTLALDAIAPGNAQDINDQTGRIHLYDEGT